MIKFIKSFFSGKQPVATILPEVTVKAELVPAPAPQVVVELPLVIKAVTPPTAKKPATKKTTAKKPVVKSKAKPATKKPSPVATKSKKG